MGRVRCRRWEPRGAPGAVLPAGRLARVRAAHPTPRARHLLRPKENNRSGAPFRLASRREPNFLYLGPGGGLYAKGAHPDCQADSGPAGGGGAQRLGPPRAHSPPGRQPGVSGTAGPGRAQQLLQDDTPAPAHRPPPPGRSSCNPRRSGASRRGRASCQATEFGVPSASPLSCSRDSRLFSCARGGRQGRHRCLFVPFAEGRRV